MLKKLKEPKHTSILNKVAQNWSVGGSKIFSRNKIETFVFKQLLIASY